jgi:hypothetical protein
MGSYERLYFILVAWQVCNRSCTVHNAPRPDGLESGSRTSCAINESILLDTATQSLLRAVATKALASPLCQPSHNFGKTPLAHSFASHQAHRHVKDGRTDHRLRSHRIGRSQAIGPARRLRNKLWVARLMLCDRGIPPTSASMHSPKRAVWPAQTRRTKASSSMSVAMSSSRTAAVPCHHRSDCPLPGTTLSLTTSSTKRCPILECASLSDLAGKSDCFRRIGTSTSGSATSDARTPGSRTPSRTTLPCCRSRIRPVRISLLTVSAAHVASSLHRGHDRRGGRSRARKVEACQFRRVDHAYDGWVARETSHLKLTSHCRQGPCRPLYATLQLQGRSPCHSCAGLNELVRSGLSRPKTLVQNIVRRLWTDALE